MADVYMIRDSRENLSQTSVFSVRAQKPCTSITHQQQQQQQSAYMSHVAWMRRIDRGARGRSRLFDGSSVPVSQWLIYRQAGALGRLMNTAGGLQGS